jgi:predicted nucleic acid-binding protein
MLLIYVLEGNPAYRQRCEALLVRARRRGDVLFTSCLALGEIAAGTEKLSPQKPNVIHNALKEMGFTFLPFDIGAVAPFSALRGKAKLKIADSIHLASAASVGIDLFLTGDKQLMRLDVPGIQFIADFNSAIL